jgi:hypothetical protein
MAHIFRHDHWLGILQRLAAAAFWPHPLVHLVNRQLCRAREEICDNHVLRCEDAPGYARVLLLLSSQPKGTAAPSTASGLARPGWRLEERVAGLLDERRNTMTFSRARTRLTVALLAVVASVFVVAACNVRETSDQPPAGEGVTDGTGETSPVNSPSASIRSDAEQNDQSIEEARKLDVAGQQGKPKDRTRQRWCFRRQNPDGSWPSAANGGDAGMDVADTALMTLGILGAGHTETTGKYKDQVARAIAWLRSQQADDNSVGGDLWTRSLSTLALCEAYQMARVPETKAAAQKAVDSLSALITSLTKEQRHRLARGNWPDGPASIAFATLALRSGTMSDLRVRSASLKMIKGMIPDLDREDRTPLNAACGMVIRMYAGYKRDDPEVIDRAKTLVANLPRWEEGKMDFRYFFLGTLAMFKVGGDYRKRWNGVIRDMLIENQVGAHGGEEHHGAWPQADVISSEAANASPRASRTYATALCAMTLEVYYRYLPTYEWHCRAAAQ